MGKSPRWYSYATGCILLSGAMTATCWFLSLRAAIGDEKPGRSAESSTSSGDPRKQKVQAEVEAEFDARQRAQQQEVQELQQRLKVIEGRLAERTRLRQKIIERRVDELLNPRLKWDEAQPHNPVSSPDGDHGPTVEPELTLGEIDLYARAANLDAIGKALQAYEAAEKHFPPQAIRDKAGKPLLSWRVALLPYLGEEGLYKQFKLDEPWDSKHNSSLIARIPQVYAATRRAPVRKPETTSILLPVGATFPSALPNGARLQDFTDGTSNTLLVVDSAKDESAVVWTKPDDWKVNPKTVSEGLFGSNLFSGCPVLFADGQVRRLPPGVPSQPLLAMLTNNGGESVTQPPVIDFARVAQRKFKQGDPGSKADLVVTLPYDGRVDFGKKHDLSFPELRDALLQAQKEFPGGRAMLRSATPPNWKLIRRLQSLCYTLGIESVVGVNLSAARDDSEWFEAPIIVEPGSPTFSATAWAQQPLNVHFRNQAAILKTLTNKSTVAFVDTQLRDALNFLQEQQGVNILIDEAALSEASIASDTAINLNLSNVTFLTTLNLMLTPLELGFTIDDEVLKITTLDKLKNDRFQDELNQLAAMTPSIQQVHTKFSQILNKPTTAQFVDTQLKDALKFLQEQHHINILIDEQSLSNESIATDTPINLQLSDVTLRSLLNLMLKPLKVTYSIENEVLMIKAASVEDNYLKGKVAPAVAPKEVPLTKTDTKPSTDGAARPSANVPGVTGKETARGKDADGGSGNGAGKFGLTRSLPNFIMMTPGQFRKAMVDTEEALQKAQLELNSRLPPGGKINNDFLQLHAEEANKVTRLVHDLDTLRQDQALQVKVLAIRHENAQAALRAAEATLKAVQARFQAGQAENTVVLDATRDMASAKAAVDESQALLDAYTNARGLRGEERLRQALDTRMGASFVGTPLKDGIQFISQEHKTLNLVIDLKALEAEKIAIDAPINLNVRDVALSNLLKLMLEPLKLTYVVENEVIKITTIKEAAAAADQRRLAELARERAPLQTKLKENDPTENGANERFMKSPREVGWMLLEGSDALQSAQKALAAGRKNKSPADRIAELDKEVAYRRKRLTALVEERGAQVQVLQIQLASAELLRKKAETEYGQTEKLFRNKVVSENELKAKRVDMDLAKLREQELKKLVDLFIKLSGDEAKEAKALLAPEELSKPGTRLPGVPGAARPIKLGLTFAQVAAKDLPGRYSVRYSGGLCVTAVEADSVEA